MAADFDHELIMRFVDGNLPEWEQTKVQEILRTNPYARRFLRDIAELAVVVADVERVELDHDSARKTSNGTSNDVLSRRWKILSLVSTLAAIAAGVLVMVLYARPSLSPPLVEVTRLHGPMQWTGSGEVKFDIAEGQWLPGGMIESLSADSWLQLRFLDGSTVTMSGNSGLAVTAKQRKELHLRYGNISLDVAKQPAGQPLMLHTPTAKLEVLGTQFNVVAESATTMLKVNEGKVRVTRLSDGSVEEVAAQFQLVAAATRKGSFAAARCKPSINSWSTKLPDDIVYGRTVPNQNSAFAKPLLWRVGKKKKPVLLHLVSFGVSRGKDIPIEIHPGARFRVRGSLEKSAHLLVGLSSLRLDGGFAGKHLVHRPPNSFEPVIDESQSEFDIMISANEFRPENPEHPDSVIGLSVYDIWAVTINDDAGLSISSIELIPPGSSLDEQ